MTDHFGKLYLPVPAGDMAPKLGVLLAFSKAVLIAQVQTAFAEAAPVEPREIVHATFAEDPRRCVFSEVRDLPALFAFEPKGEFDPGPIGDGFNRAQGKISLWWLFPPSDKERKRPMDKAPAAMARALSAALRDGRHPSYVHASDAAVPGAVRLAAAAPTVDTTYSGAGLDGAVGSAVWTTPGRVLLTKTAGDWDTSQPVSIVATLPDGTTHAEDLYFTSATDAETVEGAWIISAVISAFVPAQPSAVATLAIGQALAPSADLGSSVQEHTGTHRLALTAWERRDCIIERKDLAALKFDGVHFEISYEETRSRTADALSYDTLDTDGAHGLVTSFDGDESAYSAETAEFE